MSRTLLEITSEHAALLEAVEANGGEVSEQDEAQLAEVMERLLAEGGAKLDSYCAVITTLDAEAKLCESQVEAYRNKARVRYERIDWLRKRLATYMAATGQSSFKTPLMRSIALRYGPKTVKITGDVPEEYMRTTETKRPMLGAIDAAIKAGKADGWATLEDGKPYIVVK